MKTTLTAMSALALVIASASASAAWDDQADTSDAVKPYFGIGLTGFETTLSSNANSDVDFDSTGSVFRAGIEIVEENLSIEARFATTFAEDDKVVSVDGSAQDVSVKPDSLWGVYVIPRLPITERVGVYGLIGFSEVELEYTVEGISGGESVEQALTSDSDSDLSYGGGVDANFVGEIGGYAEYVQYYDADNDELRGLTLGLTYQY